MNNRIYIFIGIGALAIVIISILAYFAFWGGSGPEADSNYPNSVINAINNPVNRITDDFVDLVQTDDFVISYGGNENQGTFYITVGAEPLIEISKQAEKAFLEKLQISEAQACDLYVILNIPSALDDNLSQYDFGLSFCPDRPHIEDVPRQENRTIPYTGILDRE